MRIGSDNEFVEIIELERAPQDLPNAGDVRVSVHVNLSEFCGLYDAVWLEHPSLQSFIATLADVEKDRRAVRFWKAAVLMSFALTSDLEILKAISSWKFLFHAISSAGRLTGALPYPADSSWTQALCHPILQAFKDLYGSKA
jgi:hypothetical protein